MLVLYKVFLTRNIYSGERGGQGSVGGYRFIGGADEEGDGGSRR